MGPNEIFYNDIIAMSLGDALTKGPYINYVVWKLAIFDPPLLSFLICKFYVVNHLWDIVYGRPLTVQKGQNLKESYRARLCDMPLGFLYTALVIFIIFSKEGGSDSMQQYHIKDYISLCHIKLTSEVKAFKMVSKSKYYSKGFIYC